MEKVLCQKFAHLKMSMKRSMQTFAASHYIFVFIILPMISMYVGYRLIFSAYWWLLFLYGLWLYLDLDTPKVKPIKCSETRNYLFGYHPHGVLSCAMFTNFATEATEFSKKFPGLIPYPITLVCQFLWPIRREYVMYLGIINSSKCSLNYILSNKNGGNVGILVVGGAREMMIANPGKHDLVLKRRKGFIKIALKNGASLVPVFSFGENDLFVQADNKVVTKMQNFIKFLFGYPLSIFNGIGWLPLRKPVTTIVGKPIYVDEKIPNPTTEEIEDLHRRYIDALIELFESNKSRFDIDENTHLNIM